MTTTITPEDGKFVVGIDYEYKLTDRVQADGATALVLWLRGYTLTLIEVVDLMERGAEINFEVIRGHELKSDRVVLGPNELRGWESDNDIILHHSVEEPEFNMRYLNDNPGSGR